MFESHAIERVRCDEVEFSEPVLQYESIYRVNVLHSHPFFLVELPWLINRVDLSVDKYPHFKLYLEPYGEVVKSLVEALGRLETSLITHIRRVYEPGQEMLMKSMIESDDGSSAQYISVRVPQRHMYMCFDESGAGIDISSIKRGMYMKCILDLSDAWLDKDRQCYGFNARLFQVKVLACPMKWIGGKAEKSVTISEQSKKAATNTHPTNTKAAAPTKFIPNLDDILRKRGQLQKIGT